MRLGRYDVVGRLGRGGMGTVYAAVDRERDAPVALKTLHVAEAGAEVRLKREFRTVADLVHPNLAPVYELGCEDGLWFFTMEHVRGRTLTEWAHGETDDAPPLHTELPVSRTLSGAGLTPVDTVQDYSLPSSPAPTDVQPPRRSMREIEAMLRELASGIAALHDAGLRHGDIKPDNVLVRDDGRVTVVDFGLSQLVAGRERLRAGTPAYMPPEQLSGDYVGPESDWYAVGATLYRILTGRLPFAGGSMLELFSRKSHELPLAPHLLVFDVPVPLSELCLSLMHPQADQRPGREDIDRVCSGGEVVKREPQRPRRSLFVGRERELLTLEQAYGTARGGQVAVVHLEGPSGIGKSALLASFLEAVADVDAALVLRGRCYERESVPYKGFDRVVDELSNHLLALGDEGVEPLLDVITPELVRVFPAFASVPAVADHVHDDVVVADARELRRRGWLALIRLLDRLGRDRTVVLAVDDLQWADPDSGALLAELVRRASSALLVVASHRPEAREAEPLERYFRQAELLAEDGCLVEIPLGPLSNSDAERLARARLRQLGVAADARVKALVEEARGIPFFIEELAHFVGERPRGGSEAKLDEAITARVAALPEEQRRLLELVALANRPVPQALVFEAAALDEAVLMPLLSLRQASLVSWQGAGAHDPVSPYHDRIREAVSDAMPDDVRRAAHLALGRAMAARYRDGDLDWVFDAAQHLAAAGDASSDPAERLSVARLHAEAGEQAREAAAFPLAFQCFEAGRSFLPAGAWDDHYDLALQLHAGAAQAAYLCAEWDVVTARIADLKAHARSVMDQLVAWEVELDAFAGRHEYLAAVDAGLKALSLLGLELPADPGEAEVGAAVTTTLSKLVAIGPAGLMALGDLDDEKVAAITRVQVRLSPAAYFGRPMLLPIIASNLVNTSIDRGLTNATPYALALFGIVLNSIGEYQLAHTWGKLALSLIERWSDRRLETASRHVLLNLVTCWVDPLASILAPLREVFDLGCRSGDFEYASYAAHGYVHNAIYAGRPLLPLRSEAVELGDAMRELGSMNALHVHTPYEQLLASLTGELSEPWRLDGGDFDEEETLARYTAEGSRSGIFVQRTVMGLARYLFGRYGEASECFEIARAHLDAGPSVWHRPILHQYAALSACRVIESNPSDRDRLEPLARESLAELGRLAEVSAHNFAHRVSLVVGELARVHGRRAEALEAFDAAIEQAREGGWINDIALANELAALACDDPAERSRRLRAARAGYSAWGATAKADDVSKRLALVDG